MNVPHGVASGLVAAGLGDHAALSGLPRRPRVKLVATHVGTSTVVLEIGGLTLVTDPVFDAPRAYRCGTAVLEHTEGPAVALTDLPPVDAVLLSHDDHPDSLDAAGRTLLDGRPVVTTIAGAARIGGGAVGLEAWSAHELTVGDRTLRITATPCVHGRCVEVIGFVIEVPGESEAVYVSGDTVDFGELDEIGRRFTIGTALLHLGAAVVDAFDPGRLLTLDGRQGAALASTLGAHTIVPLHYASWSHFTEGRPEIVAAFSDAGLAHRLRWLTPGVPEAL
ncbi:MBL fold metallo-hydrolase [Umezawaea sp. NPDC059074]|uniref:MBL fold metallo-hydrolase n=1 Tax=Umezawaea sp. NPDC059074 TaxID=3346716 RepID=UPI0036AC548E